MAAITFEPLLLGGYAVRFRYDPIAVDIIKSLPGYVRGWDANRRVWQVDSDYADELRRMFEGAGYFVIGIAAAMPPPSPPRYGGSRGNESDWARLLFRRVGKDRAAPVFKAVTRVLHPDNQATGDTMLQQELNDAYHQLER